MSHWNVSWLPATIGATAVATPSTRSLPLNGAAPPVTVAVTGTTPRANAKLPGAVIATVGELVPIVKATGAEIAEFPALSVAMSVSVWEPFASPDKLSVAE